MRGSKRDFPPTHRMNGFRTLAGAGFTVHTSLETTGILGFNDLRVVGKMLRPYKAWRNRFVTRCR